jgi:hypothetical protein
VQVSSLSPLSTDFPRTIGREKLFYLLIIDSVLSILQSTQFILAYITMHTFKNPYSSYRGPSPLRNEYILPIASPEQHDTPPTSPSGHYQSSSAQAHTPSSPPSPLTPYLTSARETTEFQQDDAQEYDPEYATYLLASMLADEDVKERRENELVYRVQNCGVKNLQLRDWLRNSLFMREVGWRVRGGGVKRKRQAEEVGEERDAKGARGGPRVIAKSRKSSR